MGIGEHGCLHLPRKIALNNLPVLNVTAYLGLGGLSPVKSARQREHSTSYASACIGLI